MSETRNPTEVTLDRLGPLHYEATNSRGGTLLIGTGLTDEFTPVELMMAAIAGCSAVDVDHITSRRAEPLEFEVVAEGEKTKTDELGNHMTGLEVTFTVRFEEGESGDRARDMLPKAIQMSHDRLCTVSRTVQLGTAIEMRAG